MNAKDLNYEIEEESQDSIFLEDSNSVTSIYIVERYPFSLDQSHFLLNCFRSFNKNKNKNKNKSNYFDDEPTDEDSFTLSHMISNVFENSPCIAPPKYLVQALVWIETNLIPYDCFAKNVLDCAIDSSNIFDDKFKDGDTLLFMEAISGLSGRKYGLSFGTQVFYYLVQRCQSGTSDKSKMVSKCLEENLKFEMENILFAEKAVDMAYRLALSCHVIHIWLKSKSSKDEDKNEKIPSSEQEETDSLKNQDQNLDLQKIIHLAQNPPQSMILSLLFYNKKTKGKGIGKSITLQVFLGWVESLFPQFNSILTSFFHLVLFSWQTNVENNNIEEYKRMGQYALGNRIMFQFPQLEKLSPDSISGGPCVSFRTKSDLFGDGDNLGQSAFGMSCMDPNLCGKWYRLYSSEHDGFSFIQLQQALNGYSGPTICIVRSVTTTGVTKTLKVNKDKGGGGNAGLFGFYTSNGWKKSKNFYGSSDCFLYRVEPSFNVYRPNLSNQSKSSENFMYFNPQSPNFIPCTSTQIQKPYRLILGGSLCKPRFSLSDTFEDCIASPGFIEDRTYEHGHILPEQYNKYFSVDILEVWAVGGKTVVEKALLFRQNKKEILDETRRRCQMVDKKQFLTDFQNDKYMNKLFMHREGDSGRS